MTIFRCADPKVVFNKRAAALKASALEHGMEVTQEWSVEGFKCFIAKSQQSLLMAGQALYSECGAYVNCNPRVWFVLPGTGKIEESTFLPKKVK